MNGTLFVVCFTYVVVQGRSVTNEVDMCRANDSFDWAWDNIIWNVSPPDAMTLPPSSMTMEWLDRSVVNRWHRMQSNELGFYLQFIFSHRRSNVAWAIWELRGWSGKYGIRPKTAKKESEKSNLILNLWGCFFDVFIFHKMWKTFYMW